MLASLEKKEFVSVAQAGDDKRGRLVSVSAKGTAAIEAVSTELTTLLEGKAKAKAFTKNLGTASRLSGILARTLGAKPAAGTAEGEATTEAGAE